ncbi:hypothetical protein [Paenibacillus glycanilyticus]|uniref:hypothetical protein n=1 Tax=Paenibacillus glycanilyticus TaxID=126569 RepID=UPI0024E11907|nr:hypothetical protein [Paenibacillus glycanilyticus]
MRMTPVSLTSRAEKLYGISPVRPYGRPPFREEEPSRLPPEPSLYNSFDWGAPYRHAAETAARWLQYTRQAQQQIRASARRIKHDPSTDVMKEETDQVLSTVNELLHFFRNHEAVLKPQLHSAIDQAMHHPALGQTNPSVQQLIGPTGWLTCLHKALEEPLSVKALDLLRQDIPLLQPYSCYYDTMTAYWPFPTSGMLLNRRL